jgi:hypothetical protein
MDFVVGLPRIAKGYDFIWVIVNRLTKSAHFLLADTRFSTKKYAKLYFDQIVLCTESLLPLFLIEGQFFSLFWTQLQKCLDTRLLRSSAYHPQTNGQTKRVNQVLEDMLRACVTSFLEGMSACL